MEWYYSKAGVQHGPVPENELRAKLASGEVGTADLVWKDGMPDWIPASQVEALNTTPPQAESPERSAPVRHRALPSPFSPPASPAWSPPRPRIPTYLWQSIVVTLFCWPLGIPAIVYAAKVDGRQARGDFLGAMEASRTAKTWCWVAFGLWLALIVVMVLASGLE